MPVLRSWTVLRSGLNLAVFALLFALSAESSAQLGGGNGTGIGGNNFFGIVGGVAIDAEGAIRGEVARLPEKMRQETLARMESAGVLSAARPGIRVISLRRLEAALRDSIADRTDLPLDTAFLGGLQKIESVVLVPEENDLLIVGQGDGWKLDSNGAIVGANNGQPMIHLEDLIVALRSVDAAGEGQGISVSIDPTAEGMQRYQQMIGQLNGFDPSLAPALEQAMGPQSITVTGVPATSRFAQILVNADYRMKRLSMGLDAAPIEKFPSVLDMIRQKNASFGRMSPRFWMECNYLPVARSDDGMVWQLRGPGVKTLTEEQYFEANGQRKSAGRKNGFAETWASAMTERFGELASSEPAFAELRNVMDLSVVAALIRKHDLLNQANADLPNLLGTVTSVSVPEYTAPKTVSTQCSFVQTTNSWAVTASGGVLVDSWKVASSVEVDPKLTRSGLNLPLAASDRIWTAAN